MGKFCTWALRRRCLTAALALGTLLAVVLAGWCSFGRVCSRIRSQTLRLHVLANSDSAADQQLKLQVRDALLTACETLFAQADSLAAAESAARRALPALQRTAEQTVRAAGYGYPVHIELTDAWFDTRSYGDYTLPAGQYRALRVQLGEAAGQNWWCCLFPPLCVTAAADRAALEAEAAWGGEGVRFSTGGYQLRFALLEWLESRRQEAAFPAAKGAAT